MKLLSEILFLASLILFMLGSNVVVRGYQKPRQKVATLQISQTQAIPVGVVISSVNVTLPVYFAKLTNNIWEMTDQGVSYLDSTPRPGQKGNSVFYGHDFPSLLGNLKNIEVGDDIDVIESDGQKLHYQVVSKTVVEPDDVSILNNTTDARLTVYTCTGFLDSKRLVVVAKLIG